MNDRSDQAAKARDYFSRPGFKRMLEAVWKRYASLEKAGGHAVISRSTAAECEAINTFFGWYKKPGDDIRVPLADFEQELLESAFTFTITELHEVLTGEPLRTKSDRELLAMQEWGRLFETLEAQFAEQGTPLQPAVAEWLSGLRHGRAAGYRTLRELWRAAPETAQRELASATCAWNLLLAGDATAGLGENGSPPSAVRLPVLAAQTTGDPHALDRNVPAGRLLFQALRSKELGKQFAETDQTDPSDPEAIPGLSSGVDTLEAREIYRSAGIFDDDISSLVHIYCPWDGGNGPYVLSLRQVEITSMLSPITDFYVVENPAVFSTLVDLNEANESAYTAGPMLVCTSGPASAAALRLIDRYLEENLVSGHLYYSGDFDVKGISIGNVLASRYGDRFTAWRFNRESYMEGCALALPNGVTLSTEERLRLAKMQAIWDNSLCNTMRDVGRKLFQEQIIVNLINDWRKAVIGGEIGGRLHSK
ncbi:TIGR02679 domain-containing protein [Paenibacillus barengoltzii]|uniref:TIGR02679 domain-containing protein n=1 Tax=Paenibacillus barengoltzii TaxID=343517 RepID=UPI002DB5EC97|nr:TIGR02679 domain-containing protein [Paenibacillus barengoltzii]MEC2342550.1 TIGR02679 domain-containing protein [Paenibacillus barengoltzii]